MKCTILSENRANTPQFCAEHGLSYWIETGPYHILFDFGGSDVFCRNAARLVIRLEEADFAVLSHGHSDHGGGLAAFFAKNERAPVYVQRGVWTGHASVHGGVYHDLTVSLPPNADARIRYAGEREVITPHITLVSGVKQTLFPLSANADMKRLHDGREETDDFSHEQSLVVREGGTSYLFCGCAHCGILNIVARAEALTGTRMDVIFGGLHLSRESEKTVDDLARRLTAYEVYTGHCTGERAYAQLHKYLGERLHALRAGDVIER